jgi:hypothetical protein
LWSFVQCQHRAYKAGTLQADKVAKLEHRIFWEAKIGRMTKKSNDQNGELAKTAIRKKRVAAEASAVQVNLHLLLRNPPRQRNQMVRTASLQKRQSVKKRSARVTWDRRYEALTKYKNEVGDCLVPQHYAPDPALGAFVLRQRIAFKAGKLPAERVSKLDALGLFGMQKAKV